MLAIILFSILGALFFWITYKNSPAYGWILLGIVAASIGVSFIKPIQMFSLLGVVGVLVVMAMSRGAREKSIQQWLAAQGFKPADLPGIRSLFNVPPIGSSKYYAYSNMLQTGSVQQPYFLAISYHSQRTNNTTSIVLHCAFYFNVQDVSILQQKFIAAKESTPATGVFKSQLGYFNLKACDIFLPPNGGIAVRWRFPDTIEGYSDRLAWIKKAVQQ